MDTALTVRNMRRETWALMLRQQASSGLSVREWCRQNELSVKSFYYRRRQVQSMILDLAEAPTFAELPMPQPEEVVRTGTSSNPAAFIPQLTISAGDVIIGVDRNTPGQLIADVLRVIRNA